MKINQNFSYFIDKLRNNYIGHFSKISFLLFLSNCTLNPDPQVAINSVELIVDSDANDNSATAVDLVLIYKKELLDALVKMNAKDYFKATDQIKRDYPEVIDIFRWEVVPGQSIEPHPLSLPNADARNSYLIGAVVFASYLRAGEHRIRLGSLKDIKIHLTNTGFFIEPESNS